MKKLKSVRGESLVEALAAVLVVTVIMMGLSASVVAAARVNKQVQEADTSFSYQNVTRQEGTITVTRQGASHTYTVSECETKNGYRYYEMGG